MTGLLAFASVALIWPALIAGAAALHAGADKSRPSHWPEYWLGALMLAALPGILLAAALLVPPLRPLLSLIAIDLGPAAVADPVLPAVLLEPLPVSHFTPKAEPFWRSLVTKLGTVAVPALAAVYIAGAVFCLLRLAAGYGRVSAIVRRARADEAIAAACPVRVTDETATPFAWAGREGDLIILPALLTGRLQPERLDGILAHEAAHLERRDPQTGLALSMLGAVLWFNPFVRILIARWRLAAELACDARALQGADPARRKAYAQTLLDAMRAPAAERALPCPTAAFSTTKLKDEKMRLMNILKGNAASVIGWREKTTLAATTAILALAGCAGAASMAPDGAPAAPNAPKAEAAPRVYALSPAELSDGEWVIDEDAEDHWVLSEDAGNEWSWQEEEGENVWVGEDGKRVKLALLSGEGEEVEGTLEKVDRTFVGKDENGWRQVITYEDGRRVEKSWDDLTPEEQEHIKEEMARAEKEMVRARAEIERSRVQMEKDMARMKEDMSFDRDEIQAEMARAKEEMQRARAQIEAELNSTEIRGDREREMREEMREEMERARDEIEDAQRELEEQMNSPEFREAMEMDVEAEMARAREELDRARADLDRDIEEMRRERERLEEESD